MNTLLDYFASVLIGSALLLITLNANDNAAESLSVYNGDMLVQEMLVQTVHLLEGEFRNMGFGIPESEPSVVLADTSALGFLYDLDRNGTPDTIRYVLGTTDELRGTQNELDRPLYRSVNGTGRACIGVVTIFHLRYLTRGGEVLGTPVQHSRLPEVHSVEITMEVQNPYAIRSVAGTAGANGRDALYSSSLWQQTRLASQNSRR